MKSGALTHEMMESDDTRVRIYGSAAIVTALTTTKGKFSGQVFTTGTGDGCLCEAKWAVVVHAFACLLDSRRSKTGFYSS